MTATTYIDRVSGYLRDEGNYRPLNRSVTVASVPFEFAAVLIADPPAADLVLIIDTETDGIERIRRRIEAFGRALDSMRSRRPVTAVLVGHRPSGDTLDALLRCCRVLVVEKSEKEPADSDIRDRLSVLLPLSESGPVSQLANPDDELRQQTEGLADLANLTPLIEVAHRGPDAVKAALAALLQQPLTTLGEADQP